MNHAFQPCLPRSAAVAIALSVGLLSGAMPGAMPTLAVGMPSEAPPAIVWQSDYAKAMDLAEQQGKMLLVYFYESDNDRVGRHFESNVLSAEPVRQKLQEQVCLKLRRDAKIRVAGQETVLLDHAAFSNLDGQAGFAILDFAHKDAEYYGRVVSTFPFSDGACYSVRQMKIILDLPPQQQAPEVNWLADYAAAMRLAEQQKKMLLIYFCDCGVNEACAHFKQETLDDPLVRRKLQDYVCTILPLDAKIASGGKQVTLLEDAAFREMLGKPGIAIVDFRHAEDKSLYGAVVSTFPIAGRLWYTPERMAVILDLPPGTLTQRTLIYAVRIHPDKPASANGELNSDLLGEAQSHSQHQADIRVQGHHQWGSRFQRIVARLPGGLTAREVCAESWPGENLVEAAVECVRCWRLSDGHWSAVRARNNCFGYDMKRGANGVWYATGIFGLR